MTEWVVCGEASEATRGYICRVDPMLGARCVTLDPYSPPPAQVAVGVLVTVRGPDAPDAIYGCQATVAEEIPTNRWPIWVVSVIPGEVFRTWSTDNPEDLQIVDRWVAMGEEPSYRQGVYAYLHCDWPKPASLDHH